MDEEILIAQLGLLLTQVRFARRALEDVERHTARYGTFSFAQAFQQQGKFGAPPLLRGALRVHVDNLGDLSPGSGFGSFIGGLIGGVGRFIGGLFGGIVGGTLGGVALPFILDRLATIADRIAEIIERLGIRPGDSRRTSQRIEETKPSAGGVGLGDTLASITTAVRALTGLFTAAASGPGTDRATQPGKTQPAPAMAGLGSHLQSVENILAGIGHVVNGLILLVPILIGAFAMFIVRIDTIKLAIIELIQFALRNVFLLRGIALVTIGDTLSSAANVTVGILGVLATAVNRILGAVFSVIARIVTAAIQVFRFLADGLKRIVDKMVPWLITAVGRTLNELGNTRIFRVLFHAVQILPALMPPLVLLIRNRRLEPDEIKLLQTAALSSPPTAGAAAPTTGRTTPLPPLPNAADIAAPASEIGRLDRLIRNTGAGVQSDFGAAVRGLQDGLRGVGRQLQADLFSDQLRTRLSNVRTHADRLAVQLERARREAANRPQTGLEVIARAYERWLTGGGLQILMEQINRHLAASAAEGETGALGRIRLDRTVEPARATVEIKNVVIRLERTEVPPSAFVQSVNDEPQGLLDYLDDQDEEWRARGGDFAFA